MLWVRKVKSVRTEGDLESSFNTGVARLKFRCSSLMSESGMKSSPFFWKKGSA